MTTFVLVVHFFGPGKSRNFIDKPSFASVMPSQVNFRLYRRLRLQPKVASYISIATSPAGRNAVQIEQFSFRGKRLVKLARSQLFLYTYTSGTFPVRTLKSFMSKRTSLPVSFLTPNAISQPAVAKSTATIEKSRHIRTLIRVLVCPGYLT